MRLNKTEDEPIGINPEPANARIRPQKKCYKCGIVENYQKIKCILRVVDIGEGRDTTYICQGCLIF